MTGCSTRLVSELTAVSSVTGNCVPVGRVISRHVAVAGTGSAVRGASTRPAGATVAGAASPAGAAEDTSALPGVAGSDRLQPPATTLATSTLNSVIRIPASIC